MPVPRSHPQLVPGSTKLLKGSAGAWALPRPLPQVCHGAATELEPVQLEAWVDSPTGQHPLVDPGAPSSRGPDEDEQQKGWGVLPQLTRGGPQSTSSPGRGPVSPLPGCLQIYCLWEPSTLEVNSLQPSEVSQQLHSPGERRNSPSLLQEGRGQSEACLI